jgi:hypothetical protein
MERNFCGIQYTACPDSGTIKITNQPILKTLLIQMPNAETVRSTNIIKTFFQKNPF